MPDKTLHKAPPGQPAKINHSFFKKNKISHLQFSVIAMRNALRTEEEPFKSTVMEEEEGGGGTQADEAVLQAKEINRIRSTAGDEVSME